MLTIGELTTLSRLNLESVQRFVARGLYKGLRRRGRFHPAALPLTEVAVEIGGLFGQGSLSRQESADVLASVKPHVTEAWLLALAGRPVDIRVTIDGEKTVRLHGVHRAATAFEQFVLAA
jgi:hypothetical protein